MWLFFPALELQTTQFVDGAEQNWVVSLAKPCPRLHLVKGLACETNTLTHVISTTYISVSPSRLSGNFDYTPVQSFHNQTGSLLTHIHFLFWAGECLHFSRITLAPSLKILSTLFLSQLWSRGNCCLEYITTICSHNCGRISVSDVVKNDSLSYRFTWMSPVIYLCSSSAKPPQCCAMVSTSFIYS